MVFATDDKIQNFIKKQRLNGSQNRSNSTFGSSVDTFLRRWMLKAKKRRLEYGNRNPSARKRDQEPGTGTRDPRDTHCAHYPCGPVPALGLEGPVGQYIRSGPFGARGVLSFGGWTSALTLSEDTLACFLLNSSEGHLRRSSFRGSLP